MRLRRLSCVVLLLALSGCGDGKPAGETAPQPPSESGGEAPPREQARDIELDDRTLGELLEAHKKVLAAGDDVMGAMELGRGTPWNYPTYAKAMQTWQAMQDAVALGADGARKELEQLDQRIAELEAQLASAPDARKQSLQQTLELTRRMRPALAAHVETTASYATPEAKRLVETWKPRFDAAEAGSR